MLVHRPEYQERRVSVKDFDSIGVDDSRGFEDRTRMKAFFRRILVKSYRRSEDKAFSSRAEPARRVQVISIFPHVLP